MKDYLLEEINKITHVDKKIRADFINFIEKSEKLVKSQGAIHHICSFFVPVNKKRSIYLVDHIKAKMWIPTGGHIELNETPSQTVIREFQEELGHKLTNEPIKLFNISITPIDRLWQNCVTHYDFWYSVEVEKIPFKFLKKEFYYGQWFDFNQGLKKITRKSYQKILKLMIEAL